MLSTFSQVSGRVGGKRCVTRVDRRLLGAVLDPETIYDDARDEGHRRSRCHPRCHPRRRQRCRQWCRRRRSEMGSGGADPEYRDHRPRFGIRSSWGSIRSSSEAVFAMSAGLASDRDRRRQAGGVLVDTWEGCRRATAPRCSRPSVPSECQGTWTRVWATRTGGERDRAPRLGVSGCRSVPVHAGNAG